MGGDRVKGKKPDPEFSLRRGFEQHSGGQQPVIGTVDCWFWEHLSRLLRASGIGHPGNEETLNPRNLREWEQKNTCRDLWKT